MINGERKNWDETKFLLWLGTPCLGISAAYTLVTSYLPYFIAPLSRGAITGSVKNVHFLAFADSKGYLSIFLVSSVMLLASLPFTLKLFRKSKE